MYAWAAGNWHIIDAKAVMVPLIGQPGGPVRALDMDVHVLTAFLEALFRELSDEEAVDALNRLYDPPTRRDEPLPRATDPDARRREIEAFLAAHA